jgi:isoleucyl-tRNA synthetase
VGSFAELAERSGAELSDHHRPYVDDASFPCPHPADGDGATECGEPMRRVPEVIDVWFDSGAMPFAQQHFPFENEARFRERFPADFICEAQDQTRGWFYSLLAISTLMSWGAQGQHGRAVAGARHLRRGCVPLVLLHVQAAVGRLPLLG